MNKIPFILMTALLISPLGLLAQTKIRLKPKAKSHSSSTTPPSSRIQAGPAQNPSNQALLHALSQVQKGQYIQAIPSLFQLSRRAELQAEQIQIKFILGSALLEVDLNQVAAFQFVEVIKSGNKSENKRDNKRYLKSAIEKLSIAADRLGDDSLLNYAVSKVDLGDFPDSLKDMIYFRLGEVKNRAGLFAEAEANFSKVSPSSRYFYQAKYNRALAFAESNRPKQAAKEFQELLGMRGRAPILDSLKLTAQMGLARSLYQAQDWDAAMEAYREIPRDSEQWHQAQFESSWALLRSAKYRSALGQFHTMHSAFYEEDYNPESLLLRGITYLYICKFEETQKVVDLFGSIYGPIYTQVAKSIDTTDLQSLAKEPELTERHKRSVGGNYTGRLPWMVARRISSEGDVRRSLQYVRNINEESSRLNESTLARTQVARYGQRVLTNRLKNAYVTLGEQVKTHLINIKNELKDLKEQASFLELETSTGKAEILKKKISGKVLPGSIDSNRDRTFYVQNGYEYWPFTGEYWIDELGNYHYLGKSSCE